MATWNTKAELADSVDERFLALNPQLEDFLGEGVHGKFLLVAAKGMGKTLLLRHKRKQIRQEAQRLFAYSKKWYSRLCKITSFHA